jgi:hypothetical protein
MRMLFKPGLLSLIRGREGANDRTKPPGLRLEKNALHVAASTKSCSGA